MISKNWGLAAAQLVRSSWLTISEKMLSEKAMLVYEPHRCYFFEMDCRCVNCVSPTTAQTLPCEEQTAISALLHSSNASSDSKDLNSVLENDAGLVETYDGSCEGAVKIGEAASYCRPKPIANNVLCLFLSVQSRSTPMIVLNEDPLATVHVVLGLLPPVLLLSPWHPFSCLFILLLTLKYLPQPSYLHLYGFSPVCE